MPAPTATELLNEPVVQQALEAAWRDSMPDNPAQRHEEGGWVYVDTATGAVSIQRAPAGSRAVLDLDNPPTVPGSVVTATFHTHPNPSAEGWTSGPSAADTQSAWFLGVPCLIRAEDGVHVTGPSTRRGGLSGGPGYPPWPAGLAGWNKEQEMADAVKPSALRTQTIPADQALAIAQADAAQAYQDLSGYSIRLRLEEDGWHIDYELKDPRMKGGGPHYVIDPLNGAIMWKSYEQ
jgi:hypothetical protein